MFRAGLSDEYRLAFNEFGLSKEELYELSYESIECIFSDENVKNRLRDKCKEFKNKTDFT